MNKVDMEDAKLWVTNVVNLHTHDLVRALAHRYQVSHTTASATIKKLEQAGAIRRSGSTTHPLFESASNIMLVHSYTLPIGSPQRIWQYDFAPYLGTGLSSHQREVLFDGFVAVAENASTYSGGTTLHVIVDRSKNNVEMTMHDNGVGVYQRIAQSHPEMTTATELLNAQETVHPHHSITLIAPQFDYFQIEANGLHFPEEQAPVEDARSEPMPKGTTVIMGLTLNHV